MAGQISQYAMESAYKDVERYELSRTEPQTNPKVIMLGGQPGSGKSALRAEAVAELRPHGGTVVIDADRMRDENPRYKQLSIEDPQHAADRTHQEASDWSVRLTLAAIEAKRNVVVDGSMRNAGHTTELIDRFKSNGYEVEVRVLAVNPETSMTRARLRFEEQVAERGTGRFVNQEQHDNAFAGIPGTIRALEQNKLVDTVRLYDANQRKIYENQLEQGEWRQTPRAEAALHAERTRAWTHAELRDYVSVSQEILNLAKQREGVQDHVVYSVGTARSGDEREFASVHQAAQAFHEAEARGIPYATRVERTTAGHADAMRVGETKVVVRDGKPEFEKQLVGNDDAFQQAYADAAKPPADRDRKPMLADRHELEAKLDAALRELAHFEKGATFQRANDFDQLPKREALQRHPELDGAYKQLENIKQGWKDQSSTIDNDGSYATKRAELSEQLHRGAIPSADVSVDESRHAVDSAAAHRGLMVRDAELLKRDVQGEVVAQSSQHVMVKMSDMIAVRFEKNKLDRQVAQGEQVTIRYAPDKLVVQEPGHEAAREPARDMGR